MDDEPQDPGYDPDLSQTIQLAERIVDRITTPRPDWCDVVDDAEELEALAKRRCQTKGDDETVA